MTVDSLRALCIDEVASSWDKYLARIDTCRTLDPGTAAGRLGGAIPIAAAIATPDRLAEVAEPLVAIIDGAVAEEEAAGPSSLPDTAMKLVNFANDIECVGGVLANPTTVALRRWASVIDVDRDGEFEDWYWDAAFASLALGAVDRARIFAGVMPGAGIDAAGGAHGFNLQALLRHLLAAIEAKAPASSVEVAWREVLDNFDVQRDARRMTGSTLLWIARIVHHRIGGVAVADVARRLHDEVYG